MVGSLDSLDFCTECPITEKNAVPLDCWNDICLSDIWIPFSLLPNRNKSRNTEARGIYHTLEKKDPSKYLGSFAVYTFSEEESGQGEIFISDSEEDIYGSDSVNLERTEMPLDNVLPIVANFGAPLSNACSNDTGNYLETNILNKNSEVSDNGMSNPPENLTVNEKISFNIGEMFSNDEVKIRKVINSKENFLNSRNNLDNDRSVCIKNMSKSDINETGINFSAFKEFHKVKTNDFKNIGMHTAKEVNKDSDSLISLNEILDVTSEINIKDFDCDFKKRDESTFLNDYGIQEKNPKKSKKDKSKKKPSKYISLDKFLEDTVDFSQDYYCDKYFKSILDKKCESGNFSNESVRSKTQFPEIYKNENDAEEIKPSVADTKFGKIIIENIPLEVTKDDISIILCGYGEIKKISLVSAGDFLKAYVEIDLTCDIDWIIECLNGCEPFGASSKMLRCYKQ